VSLEKEITQQQFRSKSQKGLINILFTYNYLIGKMNDFFKTHQITRQQYNVLRILRGSYPKPLNINIIKERMLDKMSDASRIVERLRIKELIDRCQSSQDRRAVEIKISEKGLALLSHTDSYVTHFDDLFSSLNDDELDQLNHLLDKIRS